MIQTENYPTQEDDEELGTNVRFQEATYMFSKNYFLKYGTNKYN
jgi:hypothetical protein